ncbi:mechanosensitive ion channel family protein [Microvirga sp. 2TAF3]|uniref:mechanosensitive ion channel family protein n=1 Tax=Microvirga sp. 2TAF3 TaxID=3233014 RepID=UPI003F95DECE
MSMSPRRLLQEAAIPLICAILVILFVSFQFLATPPALGNLRLLAPAETSSPRTTLEDFRNNARRAATLLLEAYRENAASPGLFWSESVKDKVREAETLLARAARAIDLRDIPPVELEHRRLEATLLLKEILDRLPLPEASAIPGEIDGAKPTIPGWSIPGTEIRISRVTEGPRTGEYLFSSETVQRLDDFYRLIRDQPDTNGATEDFYDFFSQSPGHLLPPKWYRLIEALPASFRTEINGQAVWQWIGFVLVLGLAALAVFAVRRLVRTTGGGSGTVTSLAATVLVPGMVAITALFIAYVADYQINLTGRVNDIVGATAQGIAYIALVWAVLKLANALAGHLTFSRSESIDAHLARAAVRIAGIAIALALLVYGASYLGIPLAGLLAGLGVGGLAVALAAKPTLENFIGGLILYADRPVRVGDLCRFGNLEGRVQEIGIRSTRIRGLDRSLITIPNATFVNMNIINLTNRDRMPYVRTVGLRATDSIAIRREVEEISTIVAERPRIEPGSVQVRLRDVHEEKPKAEIHALIMTSKWDDFLQVQQEIDLMLRDTALAADLREEGAPADASNVYSLKDTEEDEKPKASSVS